MKTYIVKTLSDVTNNYQGIDDTDVSVHTNEHEAREKLATTFDKIKKNFLEDGEEELELENELTDTTFGINNGKDYYHGKIEEQDLEVKVYTITEVSVDPYDPASLTTKIAFNIEDARRIFDTMHDDWKAMRKSMHFNDNISFDDWIMKALAEEYSHAEGHYLHYIYDEGIERIFSLELH